MPQQTGTTGWFFTPVIAAVLRDQRIIRLLTFIVLMQLVMTLVGMPGWRCPVYAAFAIPCPGCGLSTAMTLFLQGEWRAATATHMFAPIFLIGIVCMVLLSSLPQRYYRSAVKHVAFLERHTGLTGFLMIGMVGYWGVRFIGAL